MKKIISYFLLMIAQGIYADPGCMDNSKHMDLRDGPDFKEYYYTQCNCPCYRYVQSYQRGRCSKCWHYRAPKDLYYPRITQ